MSDELANPAHSGPPEMISGVGMAPAGPSASHFPWFPGPSSQAWKPCGQRKAKPEGKHRREERPHGGLWFGAPAGARAPWTCGSRADLSAWDLAALEPVGVRCRNSWTSGRENMRSAPYGDHKPLARRWEERAASSFCLGLRKPSAWQACRSQSPPQRGLLGRRWE